MSPTLDQATQHLAQWASQRPVVGAIQLGAAGQQIKAVRVAASRLLSTTKVGVAGDWVELATVEATVCVPAVWLPGPWRLADGLVEFHHGCLGVVDVATPGAAMAIVPVVIRAGGVVTALEAMATRPVKLANHGWGQRLYQWLVG